MTVELPETVLVVEVTQPVQVLEVTVPGENVVIERVYTEALGALPGPQGNPGSSGASGPQGPRGPQGPAGSGYSQMYYQAIPETVWEIAHDFSARPDVNLFDNNDDLVYADVSFPDTGTVRVEWAYPMTGSIRLS